MNAQNLKEKYVGKEIEVDFLPGAKTVVDVKRNQDGTFLVVEAYGGGLFYVSPINAKIVSRKT